MKIEFNDNILKGEILIDRPLTVFTGRNGTGKSYAASEIKKKSRHAEFGRLSPMRNAEIDKQRKGAYLSKKIGELASLLETEVFGFEIKAKDGVETVTFGGRTIDIQSAPRSIEMFAPIILNLKYGTFDGGLVVLDTPEAYQDPHNQILIARFIVRLANAGLKVVLITHSDYTLNQLNNAIILADIPESDTKTELMKECGLTADMGISYQDVRNYHFADGEVKEVLSDADGFNFVGIADVPEKLYDERIWLFGLWSESKEQTRLENK